MTDKNWNPAGARVRGKQADTNPAKAQPASEFDRFEDLARKLVNVSKKELDEKRKAKS